MGKFKYMITNYSTQKNLFKEESQGTEIFSYIGHIPTLYKVIREAY